VASNIKEKSLLCSFCGQADHIATAGPQGMKIVQYFACPKFQISDSLSFKIKDYAFNVYLRVPTHLPGNTRRENTKETLYVNTPLMLNFQLKST